MAQRKFRAHNKAIAKTQYKHDGATTNFVDMFASEADMLGLQMLADQYLTK